MNSKNERALRKALKPLSLDHIFNEILQFFPVVTEEEVVKEISRLKCKPTSSSVIDVLVDLLKNEEISNEEIEEKLPLCNLHAVAVNADCKTWTTYTFEDEMEDADEVNESPQALEASIKHHFLQNDVNAVFTLTCIGNKHWMQVTEKKFIRKRQLRFMHPFNIAHFIGEPYIFVNKPSVSQNILKSLCDAFGYNRAKFSNLNGHDLESMLMHLHQKGVRRGFTKPLPYRPFKETPMGLDFSQHEERREHISNMMGPSPPKLANYAVLAKNVPWRGTMKLAGSGSDLFDMKIVFKTDDTVEMLKSMAEYGILKVPPPKYVENLLSTGRNNIKLRVQGASYGQSETETQTDA